MTKRLSIHKLEEGLSGNQTAYQLSRWKDGSATWVGTLNLTEDEFNQAQKSRDYIYTRRKPEAADIGANGKIRNIAKYIPFAEALGFTIENKDVVPWEMTRREYQFQAENAGRALAQMMEESISEQKAFLREKGVEDLSSLNEEEKRALNEEWIKVRSDYDTHRKLVWQALSEGKHVPVEVLKDYPALLQAAAVWKEEGVRQGELQDTTQVQKRDAAINKYIKKMIDKSAGRDYGFGNLATALADAIETKDVEHLRKWMNGINPNLNRLFTEITGLPAKTQKEADASIRSLNPEVWNALPINQPKVMPAKMSKEEALKKAQEAKANKALEVKLRHDGVVKTKRQFIEDLIASGYDPTIREIVDEKAKTKAFETISSIRFNGEQNIRAKEFTEAIKTTKNPPTKNSYRLADKTGALYLITKTEYDYALERAGIKRIGTETEVLENAPEVGISL